MGGFGSGRHGSRPTSEAMASYILDISSLRPLFGKEEDPTRMTAFVERGFPLIIWLDASDPSCCFLELVHRTRDDREGDRIVHDRIRLVWTVPTYGGRRWWFLCPRTGRRTSKLFLPDGGWHFWSRQAYDLGYACRRDDPFSRLRRCAAKLNGQLGGDGSEGWDIPPPKPKWMRWRTYERKYERWERVVEKANDEFMTRARRLKLI